MEMDVKQKTLLVLTILAFVFLGFQIYKLVRSDVSHNKLSAPAEFNQNTTAGPPKAEFVSANNNSQPSTSQTIQMPQQVSQQLQRQQMQTVHQVQIPSQPILEKTIAPHKTITVRPEIKTITQPAIAFATNNQQKQQYMKMVSELQLVKMKRQLLDEQAAIAQARNRIFKLDKNTRQLGGNINNAGALSKLNAPANYKLSYLGREQGHWGATLLRDGHYQNVLLGNQLADGSRVVRINRLGITLEKNKKLELITFNGAMPVSLDPVHKLHKKKKIIKKPRYSKDELALLKIPPNHYTLQLVTSYRPFVINDFIAANHLKNRDNQQHYYLYYVYNGEKQRQQILLYGNYINLYKARNALNELTKGMKPNGTRIRQLASVQRDIRGRWFKD